MAGEVISKGIKLSYGENELTDLMEIPDLGGTTEAVEVTTLDDEAHMYTDGIKNYGDNLAFKFLYKKEQFTTLNALKGSQSWSVTLPDTTKYTFGGTCSVKLDAVGVNAPLTYTLSIRPNTAFTVA